MNIWAIVPVKPLNRAKSRLAPVLNPKQREALSRELLEITLATLKRVQTIGGILVISRDSAVLSLARRYEVQTVQESGSPELNKALTRATQVVGTWNARGVLILASDLPLIRVEDLEDMLALATEDPAVVIAPDRRDDGTNALLICPPGLIPYRFGVGSFSKHIAEAEAASVEPHIYRSATLALDVDVPEDLALYRDLLAKRKLGEPVWSAGA